MIEMQNKGSEDGHVVAYSWVELRIINIHSHMHCHLGFLFFIALITPYQNDIFL